MCHPAADTLMAMCSKNYSLNDGNLSLLLRKIFEVFFLEAQCSFLLKYRFTFLMYKVRNHCVFGLRYFTCACESLKKRTDNVLNVNSTIKENPV